MVCVAIVDLFQIVAEEHVFGTGRHHRFDDDWPLLLDCCPLIDLRGVGGADLVHHRKTRGTELLDHQILVSSCGTEAVDIPRQPQVVAELVSEQHS